LAADQNTKPSPGLTQAINLPDVLGMTLKALVEGDAIAALKTADFISEFGFVPDARRPGSAGKLRTIEFTYDRMDTLGEIQTATVVIPVISLIPLPLLSIGQATIAFELEVMGASAQGGAGTARLIDPPMSSVRIPVSDLQVRFAPTSGAGSAGGADPGKISARSNMSVSIEVRQSDLPASLSQFLALASEAMVQQLAATPKSLSLQIVSPASGAELKVRAPPISLVARLSQPDGRTVPGQKIFVSQSGDQIVTFSDSQLFTDSNGEVRVSMSCNKRALSAGVTKTIFVTAPVPGEAKDIIEISAQTTIKVVPAK
jgi:Protein of unknown function (DUF2589)